MCFPLSVHQDIFYPAVQTSGAQTLVSLLLVIPCQADPNPCAEVIGVKFVYVHMCGGATGRGCRRKHEPGVVRGEEKRFVTNRKEQMALVVMPVVIFNVNIPPGATALE